MIQLDKYELQDKIGSGAYADVYRAYDVKLKRFVALKLLKAAFFTDEEAFDRFVQEAQTASELFHPNIATVLDIGEQDGRRFLVMRYIAGPSLAVRLNDGRSLTWQETLLVTRQIGKALTYAHQRGLIHRDVKPANILLSSEGAVLSDFGLVKVMESAASLTRSGSIIGTPAYLAPEVWSGKPVSPAVDQYALACVVVEMLTGQTLFHGDSTPAVMMKHFEPLVLPENWPPGVPAVGAVLRTALSKDPGKRFPDIQAFCQALEVLSSAASNILQPTNRMATDSEIPYPRRNEIHPRTFFPPMPKTFWDPAQLQKDPESTVYWTQPFTVEMGLYDIALVSPGGELFEADVVCSLNEANRQRLKTHSPGASFRAEDCFRVVCAEAQPNFRFGVKVADSQRIPDLLLIPRLGEIWSATQMAHGYGHADMDDGWSNQNSQFQNGHLIYGPYTTLTPGSYAAIFRLKCSDWQSREPLLTLDVISREGGVIVERLIKPGDLGGAGIFQDISLHFSLSTRVENLEFRLKTSKECKCTVQHVRLAQADELIWERYYALGAAGSVLGKPISLCFQAAHQKKLIGWLRRFEYGDIYWSEQFGAVETYGAIGRRYEDLGGTGSFLGFPARPPADVVSAYGTPGVVQYFEDWDQDCAIYACSFPWGQKTYFVKGGISWVYKHTWGGAAGKLGFPMSDEVELLNEADHYQWRSLFEGGRIDWELNRIEKTDIHKEIFYPLPKIVQVQYPGQIYLGEEATIVVEAENQGGDAEQGYLTISFPGLSKSPEAAGSKQLRNDPPGSVSYGRYGNKRNKAGQPYLTAYPRVEDVFYPWKAGEKQKLEINVCPAAPGEFQFFVRTSAGKIPKYTQWDCHYEADPAPWSTARMDQQDEHVFEHFIHVEVKRFPNLACLPDRANDLVVGRNDNIQFRFRNNGDGLARNLSLIGPDELGGYASSLKIEALEPNAEDVLSVRGKPLEPGTLRLVFILTYQDAYGQEYSAKLISDLHVVKPNEVTGQYTLVGKITMVSEV